MSLKTRVAALDARLDAALRDGTGTYDRLNLRLHCLEAAAKRAAKAEAVLRKLCPHPVIRYCGVGGSLSDSFKFECEQCGEAWSHWENRLPPRFRKILEACGVLKPKKDRRGAASLAAGSGGSGASGGGAGGAGGSVIIHAPGARAARKKKGRK